MPDLPAPGGVGVEIVAGQAVVVSDRGVDVLDGATGKPRWHYHELSRAVTDYVATSDTVVVTTATAGPVAGLKPGDARRLRSTALDAVTGRTLRTDERTLWQSDDVISLEAQPAPLRKSPSTRTGTVVLESGDEKKPGFTGVDARTGKRRWTWTPREASTGGCSFEPQDTDGSLLVVEAGCTRTTYALDPASGAVRWEKSAGEQSRVTVTRGGATLMVDYATGPGNASALLAADSRELWRLTGGSLVAKELAVAGDRAVLGVSDNDRGYGLRLEFVNLRTGKAERRADARAHDGLVAAGGRVYGARQWLGEHQGFAYGISPRLVPGALDVIDPVWGSVTTVPLPFAMDSDALQARPRPVLIDGDRVLRVRPSGTGLRVTSYGPGAAVKPVETGGVAPSDWPDACALTARAPGVRAGRRCETAPRARSGRDPALGLPGRREAPAGPADRLGGADLRAGPRADGEPRRRRGGGHRR